MRRLIEWLVGESSPRKPFNRPAPASGKNIFLGRDLGKATASEAKVVRWTEIHDSGSKTETGQR